MNINFELYRVFYTVANTGNITKAAEELMISQPAISKSIKNLEEQLGGQLFIRTKRGVILTDEGKEFYNYIKQAMEYIYNAENKFTYKVTHKVYENKVGDRRIVSITVHERIIDNAAGSTTTDRVDAYNIDLAEEKLLTQEEAALEVLGSNYSALIREQVKSTVIASKMIAESNYNYTITGMEQFYIKENGFHMLLNEGEVVDKSYGVVDIAITK